MKHHSHHGNQASQKEARLSQHQYDEINMPGLQGEDITEYEIDDLKKIFRSHEGIVRSVEKLPNGIITITEAQDVELRDAIVSHVSMMVTHLQEGKTQPLSYNRQHWTHCLVFMRRLIRRLKRPARV